MSRPIYAQIDLAALRHNAAVVRARVPGARVMAVVKANAYGHGAVAVAQALCTEVDAFAVSCSEEAMELRLAGINLPIVLLEGVFAADELTLAEQQDFSLVIHHQQQLEWLQNYPAKKPFQVFLKLDSGMHRLGFSLQAFRQAWQQLAGMPQVAERIAMSHFARADEPELPQTQQQFECLQAALGGQPAVVSVANSPAILSWPGAAQTGWVRPGLMLYGSSPLVDDEASRDALKPVMSLRSRVIALRELGAGESIGYGGRYCCSRPTRVGVVACGYADGYPRHAPDGTPVAVSGHRTALIGRVSMDMLTVDLSGLPAVAIGDEVELWGRDVLANEVASASQTIAYELFTKVTRRVRLDFING